MPTVTFAGEVIECPHGARLRDVLMKAGVSPHNGQARWFNCKGFGTCGTCAIEVVAGEVGPKNARERWRLDFPPHDAADGLRLACQIRVEDDLVVRKYPGFWGQHTTQAPRAEGSTSEE